MTSLLPLSAEGLGLSLEGRELLVDVNLRLDPDVRTVILGPNGAGKSLLLRVLHGLIIPSEGTIAWACEDYQARQGMVFQKPVLLRRSVASNLDHALSLKGFKRDVALQRRAEALALCGLTAKAAQPARSLSGGEQQRLAIARVWAVDPELVFLDEPTANLDPAATRAIEELVMKLHNSGCKILLTTHDLGQARRLADEILFMHRGRVVELTPANDFFKDPKTAEARSFLQGDLLW